MNEEESDEANGMTGVVTTLVAAIRGWFEQRSRTRDGGQLVKALLELQLGDYCVLYIKDTKRRFVAGRFQENSDVRITRRTVELRRFQGYDSDERKTLVVPLASINRIEVTHNTRIQPSRYAARF